MNEVNQKKTSKFLSFILRHNPESIKLNLDKNGWAQIDELLRKSAQHGHNLTFEELQLVVANNDKKRFSFNNDNTKIRANQGHSIRIDLGLDPINPPEFLFHGTADRNIPSILKEGIQKRNRQHVHLSIDKPTAIKVGSRHGPAVVLTILAGKMYKDGFEFFVSDNGVWLTDFIPSKYLSK